MARRDPGTRRGGGTGTDPDRDGPRAPRDPPPAVGEPGDRRPAGGRGGKPRRISRQGHRVPDHGIGAGPQGNNRPAALPGCPAAPHGMAHGEQRGKEDAGTARCGPDCRQILRPQICPRLARQGQGGETTGPRRRRLGLLGAGALRSRVPLGRADPGRTRRPGYPPDLLRSGALGEHSQRLRPPGERDHVRERAERAHPVLQESRRDLHSPPHQGPDAGRRGGAAAGNPAQPGPDRSRTEDDQSETEPPGETGRPGHRLPPGRGSGFRRRGDLPADDPHGEDHVRAGQILCRKAPGDTQADAAGPAARRGQGPDQGGGHRVFPRRPAVPGYAQHRRLEGEGDHHKPARPDHRLPRG